MHTDRCKSCGVELDDLINECYFAMLEAIPAYCESGAGYKFTTFLKYPLLTQFNTLTGYRTKRKYNESLNRCTSLEAPLPGDTDDATLSDTIKDDNAEFEDNVLMQVAYSRVFGAVKKALNDNPKYYDVLYMKYIQGISQTKITVKLGYSDSYVRTLLTKALRILRHPKNKYIVSFREEIISRSYHMSGLSRFHNTNESSVEWVVRKLLDNECRGNDNTSALY